MPDREPALAVLVDYENMARPGAKGRDDFAIDIVLNRLADKGRVLVKRAYADWSRYRDARHSLINAGLELIEMPSAREGAKNRADIKMAVDAMELVYSRVHLDNFVLVSGDSDFTPLVGKLRELNKRVIGVGNRESASDLLIANCDEFIFYDKLSASGVKRRGGKLDPIELLKDTLASLQREGTDAALASVVKDSMRRKAPAFDESDLGFTTFTRFLEDAGEKGIVRLEKDPRSGTYQVSLGEDHRPSRSDADKPKSEGNGRRRRGRRGSRRGRATTVEDASRDDAEVFEYVVKDQDEPKVDPLEGLPPIDQPISYEHMVMMSPELTGDVGEDSDLVEASDSDGAPEAADQEGSARGRRRRRRTTTTEAVEEGKATPTEEAADAPAPEEAAETDESAAGRRRRRVRRRATATADGQESTETPAGEAEEAAEPAAEEEKPKRRRRTTKKAA
ncbi:MAG: NYN domain-containing protein, partial [Thermoleophilia bacterium]|nr:NYN domain-containing protein [Thermoleophilia bacterium]